MVTSDNSKGRVRAGLMAFRCGFARSKVLDGPYTPMGLSSSFDGAPQPEAPRAPSSIPRRMPPAHGVSSMSKRRSPARRLSWLLVAGLVAGAVLIPAAAPVVGQQPAPDSADRVGRHGLRR